MSVLRRLFGSVRGWTALLACGAGILFIWGAVVLIPWADLPSGSVEPRSVFSAEQLHALRSYSSAQRHLGWASYATTIGLALLVVLVPSIRRLFGRIPGPLVGQVLVGSAALTVVAWLVTLPWDWMAFQRARDAGVSVESTGLWWRDGVLATLVGWVPFALAAVVVVIVVRRMPRAWPLALAGLAAAAVVLVSLIFPVVVAPLFSATHPLPDGPLRSEILVLAQREGVHLHDVVVADASRRTTAENAQVTGFGPTERLVLDDTLLRSLGTREIEVVVGHELGHAAHHDVLTGTVLGAWGAFSAVGFAGLALQRRRQPKDGALAGVVPVLFALLTVGGFLVSPLENSMSRAIESRADRDSLAATHDPEAFVAVQKQLDLAARLDPTPPAWSQFWFGSHPTVLERVSLAR